MQEHSDRELLSLIKNKEQQNYAFNLIVRKYQERLYWHIRKMVIVHDDADDLLQNTFIKAWKGLESFRGESQLFTWLYRIATNEALSFLKEKRRKYLVPIVDVERELSSSLEGDINFYGDDLQLKLQKAVLTLPEKQRLVFNMRYFDEMKYEDIAEILNTSVGALKASYHHAAKKIENFIREN